MGELAASETREAAVVQERAMLQRQVSENESLIKRFSEQLDTVNKELEQRNKHNKKLEKMLLAAQEAGALAAKTADENANDDELDHTGTVAQLLSRIAQLEPTLLKATHFASDDKETPITTTSLDDTTIAAESATNVEVEHGLVHAMGVAVTQAEST